MPPGYPICTTRRHFYQVFIFSLGLFQALIDAMREILFKLYYTKQKPYGSMISTTGLRWTLQYPILYLTAGITTLLCWSHANKIAAQLSRES